MIGREAKINNSKSEKLLGVKFDHKLCFDDHISELCKKASRKIRALSGVAPFRNISEKDIHMSAFFKSQFSFCPLVWMSHSRASNGKINTHFFISNAFFQFSLSVA